MTYDDYDHLRESADAVFSLPCPACGFVADTHSVEAIRAHDNLCCGAPTPAACYTPEDCVEHQCMARSGDVLVSICDRRRGHRGFHYDDNVGEYYAGDSSPTPWRGFNSEGGAL